MQPWVMLDTETTGLGYTFDHPHTFVDDALLEVAAILVNPRTLEEIDRFGPFAIRTSPEALAPMDEFVINMHTQTGLLAKVADPATPTLEEVTDGLLAWMNAHDLYEKVTLAGSSVKHDYEFLRRHMPEVFSRFHYRLVDVSALEEMLLAWRPELVKQVRSGYGPAPHEAMADILGSRDILRDYQRALGLDRPAPTFNTSQVRVQMLDPDLPAPSYAHPDDAGLDLRARSDEVVPAGEHLLIHTGLALEIPAGHVGLVHPRSGLAAKHGVTVLNAPGTIDSGYRGEVGVILHNTSSQPFTVARGDRIAQMVFQEYVRPVLVNVDELSATSRGTGGFGSSGKK